MVAKFLHLIYCHSLNTGDVPDEWKKARVIPIFKSGDSQCVEHYRPVSLLCTASKVFEHFVFKHLITFSEDSMFFQDEQHGFRRGFSTVTQLVHTIHGLAVIIDIGGQTDVIFLDFAKAFDRITDDKLLHKLR